MTEETTAQDRGAGGTGASTASRLAWSLCAFVLLLLAISAFLILLGWSTPLPKKWAPWWQQLARVAGYRGAPLLGGFVASRRPENAYGWLWLAFGLVLALLVFAPAYVAYALLVEPGSLPAPRTVEATIGGRGRVRRGDHPHTHTPAPVPYGPPAFAPLAPRGMGRGGFGGDAAHRRHALARR